MENLTLTEERVLNYISASINEKGYSPSVRDIQTALEIKSSASVQLYIERLESKGYITKENGRSRSIRLTRPDVPINAVPLVGRVTAGMPVLAEECFDGFITFAATSVNCRQEDLFALRISGRSMQDAGILDGDVVIVEKGSYAENGQIVVAMIEDEATVKTFYKENGKYRLQPENSEMQPIYTDEVTLLGRVVACIRIY